MRVSRFLHIRKKLIRRFQKKRQYESLNMNNHVKRNTFYPADR
jgi:hypothetical protein